MVKQTLKIRKFVGTSENATRIQITVAIIAVLLLRGSKAAMIKVVDTGPGIAPDVVERLFDPFVSTKESGLGLSICREIVEAHGGQLLVAPNLPRGTVFSISLPIAREPSQNTPERS